MSKKDTLKEGNRPHQIRATSEVFDMLRGKGQDASDGLEKFVEDAIATTQRANEAESQVASLSAQLEDEKKRITVFEENSAETQQKMTALQQEKADLEGEKKALQNTLNEANQTIAQQVKLQADIEKERDDYKAEGVNKDRAFDAYKEEIRQERQKRAKRVTELESTLSTKGITIGRLEKSTRRLKKIAIALALAGGLGYVLYLSKTHVMALARVRNNRSAKDQGSSSRHPITKPAGYWPHVSLWHQVSARHHRLILHPPRRSRWPLASFVGLHHRAEGPQHNPR